MTITTIPLNQLIASKASVRKTNAHEGIDELAASIAAHGLLQNLTVIPAEETNRFAVLAGGRRLKALQKLAKEKIIAADFPVPCHIPDGENATEISLAENTVRVQMHPADQFDAFKKLADADMANEDIAARFGIAPSLVKQRLKLAAISPKLMAEYRTGRMTLDQLMAFTLTDDHKRQEKVWKELPQWNKHPNHIRQALTEKHLRSDDARVVFIGLKAYEDAGGQIVQDLFSPSGTVYLTDAALVNKLAAAKIEQEARVFCPPPRKGIFQGHSPEISRTGSGANSPALLR